MISESRMHDRFPRRGRRLWAIFAVSLLGGCSQQQPQQQNPPPQVVSPGAQRNFDFSEQGDAQNATGQPVSPDTIFNADPSASRLQDIGGYLLLYYNEHRQLPPSLHDIMQLPGAQSLNLTSPRSGHPYTYVPNGLWSVAHPEKCIVAFDPDARGGLRWCLFMNSPGNGGALTVEAVDVPEVDFQKYKPAA